jgi:hypothetical protein
MTTPLNLDSDRIQQWLRLCGSCDAGLPMNCTCPKDDVRPVIADLVAEVKHLRALIAEVRDG